MVRISNLKLIEILRKNSRTPFLKIAKLLNVSEAAVRKKVKKLEEMGVIKKYTIEIDPKKIGFNVNVFIGIDTKPEYFITTLENLKKMKEVKNLYSATGDHMILVEAWFESSEKLSRFIRKLNAMNGVTRICPAIILEKLK